MQVFPYSQQPLLCFTETAPETWGDVRYYDEKSDIFSFAVILWRLFGAISNYKDTNGTQSERTFNFKSFEILNRYTELKEDYGLVMKNGKLIHEAQQRKIIREVWQNDVA